MSRDLSRILEKLDLNAQRSATDNDIGNIRSSENYQQFRQDKVENQNESGLTSKGLCYDSDDNGDQPIKGDKTQQTVKWKDNQSLLPDVQDRNLSQTKFSQLRKRRRSSARFLRMSGRFNEETLTDGDADNTDLGRKQEHLGEMYLKEIRMNAENKINASNAWDFKLIDNIGKFFDDDGTESNRKEIDEQDKSRDTTTVSNEKEKRINFTKASCTIDTSMKIYSIRVDDVHLSSYKVLANLNRSDGKSVSTSVSDDNFTETTSDEGITEHAQMKRKTKERQTIRTLEENMGNINISKMDYAYDIDPLFHKMSQQFDEGGAKGLLLVNLGVANDSCRLVLDSREDTVSEFVIDPELVFDFENDALESSNILDTSNLIEHNRIDDELDNCPQNQTRFEGIIDITQLRDKLQELILIAPLESINLVPQLTELRSEYDSLRSLGFSDTIISQTKTNRYANDEEEEKAAELEIHKEAIERSRVSLNVSATFGNTPDDAYKCSESYSDDGVDMFGAYDYNDDDFDDADIHPSIEYSNVPSKDNIDELVSNILESETNESNYPQVSNSTLSDDLLDAVCSGRILPSQSTFSFFNRDSLKRLTSGNIWAGSNHWKRTQKSKRNVSMKDSRKNSAAKKKGEAPDRSSPTTSFVDLYASIEGPYTSTLKPSKRKGKEDCIVKFSEKTITDKHILPIDAGVTVAHLSCFFLRPDDVNTDGSRGQVFLRNEHFISTEIEQGTTLTSNIEEEHHTRNPFFSHNDGCDESFGGDSYDGPAFAFSDNDRDNFFANDDFEVEEMQDIRIVEKVEVTHSAVSTKVDVKRLKTNLWTEIDARLPCTSSNVKLDSSNDQPQTDIDVSSSVSFRDTVKELSTSQTQGDVSFAFYFICILHLANENELQLENENCGLSDFFISRSK